MYYWLTVFSPRAVNFSLGSLSTNWEYPHSQSASWNDFRGPCVQALPHPLRFSLARARSLFRPLLPSGSYAATVSETFSCVVFVFRNTTPKYPAARERKPLVTQKSTQLSRVFYVELYKAKWWSEGLNLVFSYTFLMTRIMKRALEN